MRKRRSHLYSLLLLTLLIGLGACAKRDKQTTVQSECPILIEQATELYAARRAEFDEVQGTRIANLIEAAKIDREHGLHAACMDKASRAIVLANQATRTGQ